MATYVPNATQATEPVESRTVESAALEFRTLKSSVNTRVDNLQAEVDANSAATLRAPLPETTINAIPTQANRSGKFLAFDSVTGQPISGPLITDWTITQAQIGNISTVAGNTTNINTVATNIAAVNSAYANATAAAASATAASTSATNAANSASAAATSASGASGSASAASASASAAAISASNAYTSSIQAANSADFAWTSATAASTSATNASNSAISASSYAAIATTQAASASGSASSAATSAGNASVSASNANSHASSASASAANAAASAASASAIVLGVASGLPSIKPTLNLDFANSQTVDPRITFTRTGTAAYYDGKTTVKAEENLLTYSQEFDNAVWGKSNATVTANTTVAPDGTSTADTITDDATSGVHRVERFPGSLTGSWVLSVYAKAGTGSWLHLRNNAVGAGVWFNLSTGVIGTQDAGYVGTITSVGSGWYRCSVVSSASISGPLGISMASADAVASYVGTGSTIYIWGAQLEQRSTVTAYTPTTTQAITNYIPAIQYAPANTPRIDFDPITGECKGLLIEEQRTNLLTYSEQFDNAAWVKNNTTINPNNVFSPDGTLTADSLYENSSNGNHSIQYYSLGFLTVGQTYTLTVYAKYNGRNMRFWWGGTGAGPQFNLQTGVLYNSGSTTASITSVGGGWYKCTSTYTVVNPDAVRIYLQNSTWQDIYTGDGYSGIYIWGAQLEAGAFPTSYIPTVASQVTRGADSASMTGVNFSSWYRQDEGSFLASYSFPNGLKNNFTTILGWGNNGNNRIILALGTPISGVMTSVVGMTNTPTIINSTSYFNNGASSNLYTNFVDGGYPSNFVIGAANISGVFPLTGHIKKLAYYPKRLSNTELQALTA